MLSTMRAVAISALMMLGACGASLGGTAVDDPSPDASAPDSPLSPDAPACIKRPLYLSFEGEALTDAPASDAKQNLASWMTIGNGTVPRFRAGSANRAAEIQAIVDEVTARLAPFTTVTTTRPATGEYMMIVFGGSQAQVGSNFGFVQELDCTDAVQSDVAWVGDNFPLAAIPNAVMGSIGFAIGLTATTDPSDCMCSWDNDCRYANTTCTLHDGIARDPTANQRCAAAPATQDEVIAFNTAFCN